MNDFSFGIKSISIFGISLNDVSKLEVVIFFERMELIDDRNELGSVGFGLKGFSMVALHAES